VVRLTHRLGNIYEDFLRMRGVVTAILAVGLALGIAMALLLARSIVSPVKRLGDEIQEMAASKQLTPVPERGSQEIQILVQTINILVERLNAQEAQRRNLLANLVHELGRPLGALKSAIDALLGGAAKQEELREEMLTGMADEIVLLQRLLDDLARLYDKEAGQIKLIRQPVAMSTWLAQLLLSWQADAQKKGLHWRSTIPADLPTLQIDPGRMAQAVGNLLSNAIRYTPATGVVEVSAGIVLEQIYIRIRDTGFGISAEEQAQVFMPFYRGQGKQRFPQGLGLGLGIAHDLILAHGGTLSLESSPGQGSTFTVWLPIPTPEN
jgi:signal transduction histidine kinase